MSISPLVALRQALQKAEQFIAGFEDDVAQQPVVAPLLAELRDELNLLALLGASSTFVHTARPAHVSQGEHANQRRFGPHASGRHPRPVVSTGHSPTGEFSVYRDGCTDHAEIEISIGLTTCARFEMPMNTDALREAAARLLDAAHDIEAHPASMLVKAGEGSQA